MLAYLKMHWRGQQSVAWSLLVNGLLAYIVLLTVLLTPMLSPKLWINILTIAYLSVAMAWLGWFAIGTARSAVRALSGGPSVAAKIIAIIALLLVATMIVFLVEDAQIIVRWITG